MNKAIIFDMDGVISDTQSLCAVAESQALAEWGIAMSPEEISRRFAGIRSREWLAQILAENGRSLDECEPLAHRRWELVQEQVVGNIREIPGSVSLIRMLASRHIPLAVASASRRAFIDKVLSTLGITECFQVIVSTDDVARGKPDPESFLTAAARLGVEPSDCTVIEDAINGMLAAKAAGMRCIGLVSDFSLDYPADIVCGSHVEIANIFAREYSSVLQ